MRRTVGLVIHNLLYILVTKHSWRVQARRSIIGVVLVVSLFRGKFGGSSSSSEAKRASGVRIPVRRDSLLAKRASEGEEREGSLAKRAVCAGLKKKS